MNSLMRHLRRAALRDDGDGQLLERFLARREEAAFEALVRRHGPMVWGVCRRVLGNAHDAEDAFQATFLVLVRKAASVRPPELVGNWLYGVACRTAVKARALNTRRRLNEKQLMALPELPSPANAEWEELLPHLDWELSRLPDKYRVPVVLCELEGKSRKEVARLLHIPEGTLSSRLAMARKLLAKRMARYGPTLTGASLTALAATAASGGVPPALMGATVKVSLLAAAGLLATSTVSPQVVTLTEGVLTSMLLAKLRMTAVLAFALISISAGAAMPVYWAWAEDRNVASAAIVGNENDWAQIPGQAEAGVPADPVIEADPPKRESVKGSGNVVTKEIKVTGFTSVDVGSVFQVEIVRGDRYRTTVTTDDNLHDFVKAEKEGDVLHLRVDTQQHSIQNGTWKATVTMPRLDGLTVGGACRVTCKGFDRGEDFQARLGGASKLDGEIKAGQVTVEVGGASQAKLTGTAKHATLTASGASRLLLKDFALAVAVVHLEGASTATVNARDKLDYRLGGASQLKYVGDPTIGEKSVTGASRAGRER